MAEGSILSDAQFRKLVRDLKKLLTNIDSNAKKPVANALVGAYWRVGERIVSEGLTEAAGYGEAVLERLAEGLDIHRRTLQRSIVFFQEYHRAPSAGLSWAHYRELLTISDPDERSFYEQLAIEQGLSRDKMNAAIRGRLFEKEHTGKPSKPKLERPSDRRYVYPATVVRVVDGDTLLVRLDLGLGVRKEQRLRLAAIDAFAAGSSKGRAATKLISERLALAKATLVKTERMDLHGRYVAHVFYATRRGGVLRDV